MFSEFQCFAENSVRCQINATDLTSVSNSTFLGMPDALAIRTTKGLNSIVSEIMDSATILSGIENPQNLDSNVLWFIYSVVSEEGKIAIQKMLEQIEHKLLEELYPNTSNVSNITEAYH
jgi:hypothetical protein